MFNRLDLNLLRIFDAVMAEQSLTRAAQALALTQPAVSNALRRLKGVLQDELFVRRGQGVTATPYAQRIWPQVRLTLQQLEATLMPVGFDAASANQAFTLSMADATATALMPQLLRIVEQEAPGVSLRVLPLTTRDPRRLLEEAVTDMAIGYFPAVMTDLTARTQAGMGLAFEHQRLYDSNYLCVMRRDHPLAQGPLTLEAYCAARHLLVSFSGRPFGFVDEALGNLGRQRRVVLTVNQFFTAGQVVAASDLLTVLPQHFIQSTGIAEQLVGRALPFAMAPVHVDLLWSRRPQQTAALEWLRQALLRSAQPAPPSMSNPLP
jgi:DNA-binding transcriptional LysR family regulator